MGQSSLMETEKITGLGEGPGRIGAWMLGGCGLREWRGPSDGYTERRGGRPGEPAVHICSLLDLTTHP